MDNLLQHLVDAYTVFGGNKGGVLGLQADHIFNLLNHSLRLRAGQIDLVDHREHIQIVIQCQIHIGQGLGFNALGRVHHQNSTVTGRQRAADLIIKVHMPRRVNQVKNVLLPILGLIYGAHGLGLDGDAPLPLQFHIIQHLGLHLPAGQKPGTLNDPVRQCGLAVVNMGHDAKIPYPALLYRTHPYFLSTINSPSALSNVQTRPSPYGRP